MERGGQRIGRARLGEIDGIGFRKLFDPKGDTATFLGFNFPSEDLTRKFQKALADEGVASIYYKENAWHYAPRWEHLIAGATANSKQYPFKNSMYGGTVTYDVANIPQAEDLIGRTLFMIIPVKMSDEKRDSILGGIRRAAKVM